MKTDTKYHKDGTITAWNIYNQAYMRAYPSDISDRVWATQTEETREKWRAHEKKHRKVEAGP